MTSEKPLGELFSELANDTTSLVHHEIAVARNELETKAGAASGHAAVMGVGGAMIHVALLTLLFSLIAAMGLWVPIWVAALAMSALFLMLGWALTRIGLAGLKEVNAAPSNTARALSENKEWLERELTR